MNDAGHTAGGGESGAVTTELGVLASIFGVPTVDTWRPWWTVNGPVDARHLPAYIGMSPSGVAIDVDIMATALGGNGPHGVLLGGPGTGKTEALTTFVLSLCSTYPPEDIRILLIGGDLSAPREGGLTALSSLPHVDIVGQDLSGPQRGEELLVAAQAAISAELRSRRQQLRQVHPARRPGHGPHLQVVIDDYHLLEAGGLADRWRSLMWRLMSRGAPLNMHLLVSSRVLSPAIRMLLPHCGYRIVMGTHDIDAPADFRAVRLSGDGAPGLALLATDDADAAACTFFHPSGDDGRIRDALIDRILTHTPH